MIFSSLSSERKEGAISKQEGMWSAGHLSSSSLTIRYGVPQDYSLHAGRFIFCRLSIGVYCNIFVCSAAGSVWYVHTCQVCMVQYRTNPTFGG